MADSIKEIASRLKRQTRNAEILALCDYVLEGGAQRRATGPENRATVMNREGSTPSPSAKTQDESRGSYNSYMREYMRQWREKRRKLGK